MFEGGERMDEPTRRIGPRAVLGVLGLVLVAMVLWAASALASGGSSESNEPASTEAPAAVITQSDGVTSHDDCPNRDRDSAISSDL
jgi:hypothetical protein